MYVTMMDVGNVRMGVDERLVPVPVAVGLIRCAEHRIIGTM